MKRIDISTKKFPSTFAIVDDEDYDWLNQWKWKPSCYSRSKTLYAVRNAASGKSISMHRAILNPEKGVYVDHINCNGLYNRRDNLRTCSASQNQMNSKLQSNSKSGYKGVSWNKQRNKWTVFIKKDRKRRYGGAFSCLVKAAEVYDKMAKELFGEFARLNFPEGVK